MNVFIFCLVLFIYVHVQFHLKTSNDLEMYEIDQPSKDKLEDVCDLRQPVLFDFDCQPIMDTSSRTYIADRYSAFELKIRNVSEDQCLHVPLQITHAIKLFDEDSSGCYISENNMDMLDETGIGKELKCSDEFLRPYMVSNCYYDVLMGSNRAQTPFRFSIHYRNYFLLTQGAAQIKMAPPHSIRYLYPNYDYDNFEFRSPVNPWNPQPNYSADFDKIKCLEFTLVPGKTLFIPAYWWYSIQLDNSASISCFSYRTYMNNVAILPHMCLHFLQLQNIKRRPSTK